MVVVEASTSETTGVIASEACCCPALSATTVAVLVIGTPSALYGRSGDTRAVTRICACAPFETSGLVYVTVSVSVSATI
ncbi:hypothetical protein D3C74_453170 [compost metagenome]